MNEKNVIDSSKSEIADGMRIEWDVPIEMDDGVVLRADIYRPIEEGRYPVILSHGPYGKNLLFQQGYPTAWEQMVADHPDVAVGSTNKYQAWEVVDPEKWVPEGYACVRVDSRGAGRSPGRIACFSPRETKDFYECIEWAGTQPWSNGKVGLNGISYYAMNQWQVASLQPPHLAAMCAWEGSADWYREATRHGGILSTFFANWYDMQVKSVQHGLGERGPRNPHTGMLVCGDETLSEEELSANRIDFAEEVRNHPLDETYHRDRSPDFGKIKTPLLSAASLAGQGLHPRGNYEGFMRSESEEKWLECHGLEHWTHFYTDYGRILQRGFFDHFLKGEGDWKEKQPRVLLQVRYPGERFGPRGESEWPLSRTQWTKFYLDPEHLSLNLDPGAEESSVTYEGLGEGVTFRTPPFGEETEITGPFASKLWVSSATTDVDLFLVVRLFDPDGEEVVFRGTVDPHTPIAQGWLRASHRKLDPEMTQEWRPYHTHDEIQSLTPGEVYELDVEIWPTCIVVPAGYHLALTVRGKDYEYAGAGASLSNFKNVMRGSGPFLHDDPVDRPPEIFGGNVTVHAGGERPSYLLLPVIPNSR